MLDEGEESSAHQLACHELKLGRRRRSCPCTGAGERTMDEVPAYIREAVAAADQALDQFAETRDEDDLVAGAGEVRRHLERLREDDDVWDAASEIVANADTDEGELDDEELADAFEEELDLVTDELDSPRVALDATMRALEGPSATPEEAREMLGLLIEEGYLVEEEEPGPRRVWRAVRFVGRSLIVLGNGALVVVDAVSPDMTMVTKVLSIARGSGGIIKEVASGRR